MRTDDSVFLKKFSLIIIFLIALAVGLIFLARHINHLLPWERTEVAQKQLENRIAPVGAVFAGDSGVAAQAAAAAVMAAKATANVPFGGSTDGKVIYDGLCFACHTSGAGGAPMLNAAGIGARAAKGADLLHKHAIEGFTGTAGVMPAKGGNPALTDAQVMATVDWMLEHSK